MVAEKQGRDLPWRETMKHTRLPPQQGEVVKGTSNDK